MFQNVKYTAQKGKKREFSQRTIVIMKSHYNQLSTFRPSNHLHRHLCTMLFCSLTLPTMLHTIKVIGWSGRHICRQFLVMCCLSISKISISRWVAAPSALIQWNITFFKKTVCFSIYFACCANLLMTGLTIIIIYLGSIIILVKIITWSLRSQFL